MPLKPIIKWSGGKTDEIKIIEKYIPEFNGKYIEPFVGGGALYFHLQPKKAVISDVHKELIAFYKAIADGKAGEIKEFMDTHQNNEETYYSIRNNSEMSDYCKFYYLRKTCYRGMMRYNKSGGFNVPFGRYKTLNYNELDNTDYYELLNRTEILNEPFESVFQKYSDDPDNFIFLDPPYDSVFTDYGYCKFDKQCHKKLAELFKNAKCKCMIDIAKTDFIYELYKDYIIFEFDKKYKFKIHSGRVDNKIDSVHIIAINYKLNGNNITTDN